MLVGAVIVIADIFGGNFLINPIIFLIGYIDALSKIIFGIYLIFLSKPSVFIRKSI